MSTLESQISKLSMGTSKSNSEGNEGYEYIGETWKRSSELGITSSETRLEDPSCTNIS